MARGPRPPRLGLRWAGCYRGLSGLRVFARPVVRGVFLDSRAALLGDGQQVTLFAAMLHQDKVVTARHAIPEDTNEITQVRHLLDPVGPDGAVVTGDAARAQRETAAYLAGPQDERGPGRGLLLARSRATSPGCSARPAT